MIAGFYGFSVSFIINNLCFVLQYILKLKVQLQTLPLKPDNNLRGLFGLVYHSSRFK